MERKDKIIKVLLSVAVFVLAVALIVAFSHINELKTSLSNLETNLYGGLDNVNDNIDKIYNNVDEKLKKQVSILSGYDVELGPLDTVNFITPIIFTVTPKNLSDDTSVSVTIGDTTANLVRDGGIFKGVIDTDVFIEGEVSPLVSVTSSGNTQNEYLEYGVSNLFTEFMPYLSSHMTVTQENFDNQKVRVTGDFIVDYKPSSAECKTTFTQYYFTVESEKKEIFRKDITKQVEEANGDMCQLSVTFSALETESFEYYIIATDSLGLTHKTKVMCTYMGGDNTITETIEDAVYTGNWIYDSKGNLLYGS